jgi:hypothetical protein
MKRSGDELVTEIVFVVEEAAEGGYLARAVGRSISLKPTNSTNFDSACATRSRVISMTAQRLR